MLFEFMVEGWGGGNKGILFNFDGLKELMQWLRLGCDITLARHKMNIWRILQILSLSKSRVTKRT